MLSAISNHILKRYPRKCENAHLLIERSKSSITEKSMCDCIELGMKKKVNVMQHQHVETHKQSGKNQQKDRSWLIFEMKNFGKSITRFKSDIFSTTIFIRVDFQFNKSNINGNEKWKSLFLVVVKRDSPLDSLKVLLFKQWSILWNTHTWDSFIK